MFKPGKTYRTRNGYSVVILGTAPPNFLIGYIQYDGLPLASRWLENGSHEKTDVPGPYDLLPEARILYLLERHNYTSGLSEWCSTYEYPSQTVPEGYVERKFIEDTTYKR